MNFSELIKTKRKENNGYLLKSLYIDGKVIDHLWIYDITDELIIGDTYKLTGVINIYTKEIDGKLKKNYGIKVNELYAI